MMEPAHKCAIVFVDGQNLFHSVKDAFGYIFPNFDIRLLASEMCAAQGWDVIECRFYTGIPNPGDNAFWNSFWVKKTAQMGRAGIKVFTRPLRYRNKVVQLPDGNSHIFLTGEEKGIDVRIALDILTGAVNGTYDVAWSSAKIRTFLRSLPRFDRLRSNKPAGSKLPAHFHGVQLPTISVGSTAPIG